MTRDEPSDFGTLRRTLSVRELRAMLDMCLTNPYLPLFPMNIDPHTYPDGADERTLLQYKIAVEQAALDGKPIEMRLTYGASAKKDCWMPFNRGEVPSFFWSEHQYRVAKPKVAAGHNPGGVTEDQIPEGWRLFSVEEFKHLESSRDPGNIYDTRFWDGQGWSETGCWSIIASDGTLITQKPAGFYLPKPKPVQPSTILGWLNTLPDGYRERALRNHFACRDEWPALSASSALTTAFYWHESPEGRAFWEKVYDALCSPLHSFPPLPEAPKKVVPWSLDNFVWPDCVRCKVGGPVFGVQIAGERGLFLGVYAPVMGMEGDQTPEPVSWKTLADHYQYSVDNGKTWQPCRREEVAS